MLVCLVFEILYVCRLIQPRDISINSYQIGSYYDIIERELGRKKQAEKQGYADDYMREISETNFQNAGARNIKFRAPLTPYGGAMPPRKPSKAKKRICEIKHDHSHHDSSEYQVGAGNNFDLSFFQSNAGSAKSNNRDNDGLNGYFSGEENLMPRRKKFFYEFEFDDEDDIGAGDEKTPRTAEQKALDRELAIELRRKNRKRKTYSIYGSNNDFGENLGHRKPPPGVLKKLRKDNQMKKSARMRRSKRDRAQSRFTETTMTVTEEDEDEFTFGSTINPAERSSTTMTASHTQSVASVSGVKMHNQVHPSSAMSSPAGDGNNHYHHHHHHHHPNGGGAGGHMYGISPSSVPQSYTNSSKSLLSNRSTPNDPSASGHANNLARSKSDKGGFTDFFGNKRYHRSKTAGDNNGENFVDGDEYDDENIDEYDDENMSRRRRNGDRRRKQQHHHSSMHSSEGGASATGSTAGLFDKTRSRNDLQQQKRGGGGKRDESAVSNRSNGDTYYDYVNDYDDDDDDEDGDGEEYSEEEDDKKTSNNQARTKMDRTSSVRDGKNLSRNNSRNERSKFGNRGEHEGKNRKGKHGNHTSDEDDDEGYAETGGAAFQGSNNTKNSKQNENNGSSHNRSLTERKNRGKADNLNNEGRDGSNKSGTGHRNGEQKGNQQGGKDGRIESSDGKKSTSSKLAAFFGISKKENTDYDKNEVNDSSGRKSNTHGDNEDSGDEKVNANKRNKSSLKNKQSFGNEKEDMNNNTRSSSSAVTEKIGEQNNARNEGKEEKSGYGLIGKFLSRNKNKKDGSNEKVEDEHIQSKESNSTNNSNNRSEENDNEKRSESAASARFGKSVKSKNKDGTERMNEQSASNNEVSDNEEAARRSATKSGKNDINKKDSSRDEKKKGKSTKHEEKAPLNSNKHEFDLDIESISLEDGVAKEKKDNSTKKWGDRKVKCCGMSCINNRRRLLGCLSLITCLCCLLLIILAVVILIVLLYAYCKLTLQIKLYNYYLTQFCHMVSNPSSTTASFERISITVSVLKFVRMVRFMLSF